MKQHIEEANSISISIRNCYGYSDPISQEFEGVKLYVLQNFSVRQRTTLDQRTRSNYIQMLRRHKS